MDIIKHADPKKKHKHMSPTQIIAVGFLCVIIVGALVLSLPISSADHAFTPLDQTFFTAVSATCVTGLVVVDTAVHWSVFGQIVILLMIQIGGLGFMTVAVLLSFIVRRHITPRERIIIAQSFNIDNVSGTIRLMRRILIGTLIIETGGAAILATQFIPIFGVGDGIYKSIFHSVSAFCNAGFDLLGTYSGKFASLADFYNNYVVNITVILLIIIGGIGFVIWNDMMNHFMKKTKLSVYTKFILIITAVLVFGGAIIWGGLEWNNPETIGNMRWDEKILASLFQSVTMRTAGFATVDNAKFTDPAKIVAAILMFIGGASGSTAGGVKVGTIGVILCTVVSVAFGKKETVIFKRRISTDYFVRATSIVVFQIFLIVIGTVTLVATGNGDVMASFYESVSACGTVGVTLGITPYLNVAGEIALMLMMYLGRVGILTVTYSIMLNQSDKNALLSHADTRLLVG